MGSEPAADARLGLVLALSCYTFWGLVTVYWRFLGHVPAIEVIAHRALWSFVFVGAYLLWKQRLIEVRAAFLDRRSLLFLGGSAVILFSNWLGFVWGVQQGYILETSFGYFINPLMSVALGFLMLGERLNRAQTLAIGLAAAAVLGQAIAQGSFPVLSVYLAATFALYGYMRKVCAVRATTANFVESLLHLPPAIGILAVIGWQGGGHFADDLTTAALLVITGPITAVPLIAFAAAAQRLPLATMGLLQYIVPSLQFLLAIAVFGQELSTARLLAFALIWVALAIFTLDVLRRARTR